MRIPRPCRTTSRVATVAAILAFSSVTFSQVNPLDKKSTSKDAICPLSDSQTQKSIDAFAKMVPTFTQEPRCVNCHGGVNPLVDDPTQSPSDPSAARFEHGPGKVEANGCASCHSNMPLKSDGKTESKWQLATQEHFFLGKDAKTLCKQMRSVFVQGADFIQHFIDDNGNSNFTETAFLGTRGLNDQGQSHVTDYKPEPPLHITQGGLIQLGKDWIAAMGGEFKGDVECGCEPVHYTLRISAENVHIGFVKAHNVMAPIEVPITFHDDGTFTGDDATASFQGTSTAMMCRGQSTNALGLRVSGDAVEEFEKNVMHIKLDKATPDASHLSVQCPYGSASSSHSDAAPVTIDLTLSGKVRESLDYLAPSPPGVISTVRTVIVKRDSAGP